MFDACRVNITKQRQSQRLYEALLGQLTGVDAALETAERLHQRDELPTSIFEDVTTVYQRERDEFKADIQTLLDNHPSIREHEELLAQHRILVAEYQAIHDAMQRGAVSQDVGERLLADVEVKLDHVMTDEWTAEEPTPPGFKSYWREQLDRVELESDRGGEQTDES